MKIQDKAISSVQHEFGHYIIGRAFGFEASKVCVTVREFRANDGGCEIRLARNLNTINSITCYLEQRIITLYVGVLSESLTNGKVNESQAKGYLNYTAAADAAKIRELLHLLRSIIYYDTIREDIMQQELDELNNKLWYMSIKMVEESAFKIDRASHWFVKRVARYDVECCADSTEIEAYLAGVAS